MRRLLLSLLTLASVGTAQVATITGVNNISNGHSAVQLIFDSTGAYDRIQVRHSDSTACSGGTGGIVQPASTDMSVFLTSGMTIIVGGLTPGVVNHICVELSNTGGAPYTNGVQFDWTPPALPAVHPAIPVAPVSFDSSYPDTGTGLTTCPTNSSTGYCILQVASDCSDLQTQYDAAMTGQSATQGYVIMVPHSATPCSR